MYGDSKHKFYIPQRYVLGLMGLLAVMNAYTMRVSLSVAITEMVRPKEVAHHNDGTERCYVITPNNSTNPEEPNDTTTTNPRYDWSETTQGLILSSFFWGYVLTHLPGGVLAEKLGGKYTLGLGILSTAIFTLLTPWVIVASDGNPTVLILLRVVEGFGEGTTFPALNALLACWIPLEERSRIGTLVYAGAQIGTIVSNAVSGALIAATNDWASVFYLFGGLGILWFILWVPLCYSTPDSHPFITDIEKTYIQERLSSTVEMKGTKVIPWKSIMTSVPLWALIVSQFGHDWGFFTMITDLPKYMKDVLGFDVKTNGLWSSIPYVFMWIVSMASSWLCDHLIKSRCMTVTFARKFFTTIASVGPSIFIIVASYSGCNSTLAVSMFTLAMGLMGTFYCGMKVNALDLSPNYAGTLMALVNGIGAIAGIVAPYIVGVLTPNQTLDEWRTVFWITFGVFTVTNIIYTTYGSGEVQRWNRIVHL